MKNYLKNIFLIITIASLPMFAESNPNWINMDRYQVPGTGPVFLIEHAGWQFPSCPSARHAKLNKTLDNFDQMYSMVLASYLNDTGLILHGTCDVPNAQGVIDSVVINYILLQDK